MAVTNTTHTGLWLIWLSCVGDPERHGTFSKVGILPLDGARRRGSTNSTLGEAALVPEGVFPDDLDTTSLALTVLQPPSAGTVSYLLDLMAGYVNSDGTFQVNYHQNQYRQCGS